MKSLRYHTSHLEHLPLNSMQLTKDRFRSTIFSTPLISHIAKKKRAQIVDYVIQKNVIRTNNITVQSSSRHNIVDVACMPIYTQNHIQHQKWSIHKLKETFSVSVCEPRAKHNSLHSAVPQRVTHLYPFHFLCYHVFMLPPTRGVQRKIQF